MPRTRCAPLPLAGRGWGWGSVLGHANRATTTTPTPPAFATPRRIADASHRRSWRLRTAAEGRLSLPARGRVRPSLLLALNSVVVARIERSEIRDVLLDVWRHATMLEPATPAVVTRTTHHDRGGARRGAISLRLGMGSKPSRCASFLAALRPRRIPSAFSRVLRSDGFSYALRRFISRKMPSRCSFFLSTLRA